MRLSEREAEAIRAILKRHFGPGARIWLFGSRAREDARGGDIDLLVEPEEALADPFKASLNAEVEIQMTLDDPKIDILVHQPGTPEQPLHRIARETGILL
jgi:predicted nucleotidyltransferase